MPTMQVESDQLLNAALQMPDDEFQHFVTKLFTVKARTRTPTLSERESDLLPRINQGLSATEAKRMRTLIGKRQSYAITETELQELMGLTDESERLNVERMKALLELAQMRGVTLDEVMKQLQIRPTRPITSFLQTARSLQLDRSSDWSERIEEFLYGKNTDVTNSPS